MLELLISHGWRPAGGSGATGCGLLRRLDGLSADRSTRRRLLVASLGCSEGADEAARVLEELVSLEDGGPSLPEDTGPAELG